jgi:hypothetical protein
MDAQELAAEVCALVDQNNVSLVAEAIRHVKATSADYFCIGVELVAGIIALLPKEDRLRMMEVAAILIGKVVVIHLHDSAAKEVAGSTKH